MEDKKYKVEVYVPEKALLPMQTLVKKFSVADDEAYDGIVSWRKVDTLVSLSAQYHPYMKNRDLQDHYKMYVLTFRCRERDLDNLREAMKNNDFCYNPTVDICELK